MNPSTQPDDMSTVSRAPGWPPPMSPQRQRRRGLIAAGALGVLLLVVAAVGATLFLTRQISPAPAAPAATPQANGIARPDASCVQTNGQDHQDMWNADGWWAGRVDGTEKQMTALAVLSLKLGGHEVDSAWICAPRPNG